MISYAEHILECQDFGCKPMSEAEFYKQQEIAIAEMEKRVNERIANNTRSSKNIES